MTKPGLLLWSESSERLLGDHADSFDIIRGWEGAALTARGDAVVATLTSSLDAATLERLPNLRLIVVPGAGYEEIDVAAARARGITIANAGDVHSGEVAEHAVAMSLASIQRLPAMHQWVVDGRWEGGVPARRHSVSAQRFGILGLGNIGTAIAKRLAPFGGEIAWWSRHDRPAPWSRKASLAALAEWCSVLIVATRGDAVGLVDAATIDRVGPDGGIVNITRGSVIDEDAMIGALSAKRLGFAALDVFVEEPTPPDRWRNVPNVLLSPHVAGVTHESIAHLREAAIANLSTLFTGDAVVNQIGD